MLNMSTLLLEQIQRYKLERVLEVDKVVSELLVD